jgi:hypothetical protein
MARITIRVDEERKDHWETVVEHNSKYNSLTHLIELSVTKELQAEDDHTDGASGGGSYDPDVTNVELREALTDLHRDLKEVAEDVGDIHREQTSDAVPAARAYFDRLPESEPEAVTPEQVAESMEFTDAKEAKDVLERLDRETARVRTTEIVGETHYYKEV